MVQDSRVESSMSRLVNEVDITAIHANISGVNNMRDHSFNDREDANPYKRKKSSMVKGNPHDDKPNRRGNWAT